MDSELEKLCTFRDIYGMADFPAHDAVDGHLKKQADICTINGKVLGLNNTVNVIKGSTPTSPFDLFLYDYFQHLTAETKGRLIQRVKDIIKKAEFLHSETKIDKVKEEMAIGNMKNRNAPSPLNRSEALGAAQRKPV